MLVSILSWVAGYCVLSWILVFCLFAFTTVFGRAHPMIIVLAPLLPFMFTADKIEELREMLHRKKMQRVSRFIVKELRRNGITVRGEFGVRKRDLMLDDDCELTADGYSYLGDGCEVFAEVAPHQHHTYGAVFGLAIRKFNRLTPKQICARCYPQEPLNRDWAMREGLTEYFAKEYYVPCEDCGTEELWHALEWGSDEAHEKRWMSMQTFYFKNRAKAPRIVSGHLCRGCNKKLGWSSSHGGALYKVPTTTTDEKAKTA